MSFLNSFDFQDFLISASSKIILFLRLNPLSGFVRLFFETSIIQAMHELEKQQRKEGGKTCDRWLISTCLNQIVSAVCSSISIMNSTIN